MPRILLIRHAEPAQGWGEADDPGLSEIGLRQAERTAQTLVGFGLLEAVTSPMRRARETAASFETLSGMIARIEPRISEVATHPAVTDRRAWLAATFPWRAGETATTLWANLDAPLQRWRAEAIQAVMEIKIDAAVFTHFIAINALVSAALGDGRTIVTRPELGSITELDSTNGALRLARLGAQVEGAPT